LVASVAAYQPSEEEPPNVIAEIWLGTSGRKLSAISFIPQSDATNRKKNRLWVGARNDD
jgi:hypothetical protein